MSQNVPPLRPGSAELRSRVMASTELRLGSSVITLTPGNREKVIQCLSAIELFSKRDGAVWGNDGDSLRVEIRGINLTIDNIEDCYIVNEIFGHGTYDIGMPGDVHVIDIGANLLIASLHFAKMEKVRKVTAFEPLKPTLEKAYHHLSLNPGLAEKIELNAFGLSDSDKTIFVPFTHAIKGATRTDSDWESNPHLQNRPGYEKQEAPLRKASKTIGEVIASSACRNFILKADCEGAETAIFQDLQEHGLLEKFSMILLEWHGKNREALENMLDSSNFQRVSFKPQGKPDLGMIYAFNTRVAPAILP
jgi:FkbM family methyltransferase